MVSSNKHQELFKTPNTIDSCVARFFLGFLVPYVCRQKTNERGGGLNMPCMAFSKLLTVVDAAT
jgi:hypothetical protein